MGEDIIFNWDISGFKKEGVIIFGDGNSTDISTDSQITHSYAYQGRYTATLMVLNYFGTVQEKTLMITIQNDAPTFSLDVASTAHEDEPVNISLHNIMDSKHDLNPGKLTFIYDFADGQQIRCSNTSLIHKWTDQGTYNLRVTVMDDQGAITHKKKAISVLNVNPIANFELETTSFPLNSPIEFNASTTFDSVSDKNSLTYIWDFNDGYISVGEYAIHQYTQSGTYDVNLTVRDDDDASDSFLRTIIIDNTSPEINFSVPTQNIKISEGETYVFNSLVLDDDEQGVYLHYWWNFNSSVFNPLDLSNYQLGGWINAHLFQDDFTGQMTVATIDAVGQYNYTQADVQVSNVAPSINIWDASVVANITFGFYQNGIADNNFSYVLIGGFNATLGNTFNLTSFTGNSIQFHHDNVPMSLAKKWAFAVNSSSPVTGTGPFRYNVTFEFLDGQKVFYNSISSGNLTLGTYGYWWINLPSWYDSSNYTFNKPITFNLNLFDPSIDTVNFTANYTTNTLLNISCDDSLPLSSSFSIGNINYNIEVFEDMSNIYANITTNQLAVSRTFDENVFPVDINSNFTIYPFMNLNDLLINHMSLTNLTIIDSIKATNTILTEALDDDLGETTLDVAFNTTTAIQFGYLSPQITLMTQNGGNIGSFLDLYARISMFNVSYYNWSAWNDVNCNFGYDNNHQSLIYFVNYSSNDYGVFLGNFSFDHQGYYLITLNTTDPFGHVYSTGKIVSITSPSPLIFINQFANTTFEDVPVDLTFTSDLYNDNPDDYRFIWNFGDGTYSYETNPSHSWKVNGTYEIDLTIYDQYGNQYQDNRSITVIDHLPEILGPYIFQGIESRNIVLDVDISDSTLDEMGLKYLWYDETNTLFSTERKPMVSLQDGIYNYTLIVKDPSGFESSANITINVLSITPEVFVTDYSYSGKPSESGEGFISGASEGVGMVDLSAFAYDTDADTKTLKYYWKISRENESFTFEDSLADRENSSVYFRVTTTTIYFGEVLAVDSSGKERQASFTINSFIDSNGNGYSDEFEKRLALTGESISGFRDSDKDGFSDRYEREISHTNASVYDSDGDGLSDGNFGESNFGTDPLSNDTDHDGLLDGVEVLGWNITVYYFGVSANLTVNSNPLVNDTDMDGFPDYSEYISGTDPKNPDTDNDGLNDAIDPYPTRYDNDDDGLSDLQELSIGTKLDQADTDGDSINDGNEIYGWGAGFKTNPLSSDTDHDFLADNAEMKTYTNKIDNRLDLRDPVYLAFDKDIREVAGAQITITISFGEADPTYGILNVPDIKISVFKFDDHLLLFNGTTNSSRYFSKVLDIKDFIESNNLNYKGTYSVEINDTNAGCLLEQFEIQVTRYLDPNNFDTDGDGIMDGVETSLLVPGMNAINFEDIYNGNLIVDNDPTAYNEFSLTIPYTGRTYGANLSLSIESEGIPAGSGNISITLLKDELNATYMDPVLIDFFGYYSNAHSFSFTSNLNISQYVTNGTLFEYYGDYKLTIRIQNSTLQDNFTLSAFSINTNTFIEANSDNPQAWITDPGSWDTDGDMWSDSYEIYTRSEPTNPLSADTDGDGALDSQDRDPLRDVMLEIASVYAQNSNMLYWERNAVLEIVISVEIGNQKYCFMTPETTAREARQHTFIWPFWHYYHYTRSRYNEITYYLNINDWVQNPITFHFELWAIGHDIGQWDTKILEGNKDCYASEPYGPTQNLYVSGKGVFGYTNRLSVDVNTVALNKTNTIAIYENTTVFNGHFQSKEKMDIIQLEVNDTGVGTPFIKGVNTIVIPTSLFTKTLLNAQIQNKQLNSTLFPENDKVCRFISIGRDGTTEEACDEIDFVIIRYNISSSDAMLILDLLLTCLVNSTTNETVRSYHYVSTKDNDTKAVLMNLFTEVLGYILWETGNYINSPQGRKPTDLGEWLVNIIEDVVNFVVGIFIAIGQFFIDLWNAIVSFVNDVLMSVIQFLSNLLEIIIKAAILIFMYIVFAIMLVLFIPLYYISWAGFLILALALGVLPILGANSLTIQSTKADINFRYELGQKDINFLDLSSPSFSFILTINDHVSEQTFWIFGMESSDPDTFFGDILSDYQSSIENQTTNTEGNFDDFIDGIFTSMDILSVTMAIDELLDHIENEVVKIITGIATIMGAIGLAVSILSLMINTKNNSQLAMYFLGMSAGLIIVSWGILGAFYSPGIGPENLLSGIGALMDIVGPLLSLTGGLISGDDIVEAFTGWAGVLSIASLILALNGMSLLASDKKYEKCFKWMTISLVLSLIFYIASIVLVITSNSN